MSMFDGILGNLDELAARVGLPAEQVQALTQSIGGKMAAGGDYGAVLTETAQEYGLPVEKLQEMLAAAGGPEAILGKLGSMFGRDGDGNPINELSGFAKGLFG